LDPDAEKGFSRIPEKNTGNSGMLITDARYRDGRIELY